MEITSSNLILRHAERTAYDTATDLLAEAHSLLTAARSMSELTRLEISRIARDRALDASEALGTYDRQQTTRQCEGDEPKDAEVTP